MADHPRGALELLGFSPRCRLDMRSWFSVLPERPGRRNLLDVAAVLAVTVSVQGVVVCGQFLLAFVVKPEQLGVIRLLESAFAIALLASSCGMPSVVFREAAVSVDVEGRTGLITRASVLTSLVVALVLLIGFAVYATTGPDMMPPGWAVLVAMSGALWPANVARIAVAAAQGAQMARLIWGKLLVYSSASVMLLFFVAWLYGINGWVVGRYTVEVCLAALIVHALVSGPGRAAAIRVPALFELRSLFWLGTTANFAFLIRAVSDNLPILLLKASSGLPEQLGWYGFAGLAMFAPNLLLSVLLQEKLPSLVQSVERRQDFGKRLTELLRRLQWGAALSAGLILVLALLLHWKVLFVDYAAAAWPMLILGASLPFRAFVLAAGGAAVAYGRYAISSVLALAEIFVVLACSLSGHANTAVGMAAAFLGASIFSASVALILIQHFRRIVR